jgi:uncharacterized membrane protein YkoI
MLRLPIGLCVAACLGSAAHAADRSAELLCLSQGDALEIVTAHEAIPLGEAVGQARRAVPNAEVMRAALCREPDALVYRIIVLRKDGRVVHVSVDAPSGSVKTVH